MGRASITLRLTLLFSLASAFVLLALGLVIAASVEKHFEEQDLEVLQHRMAQVRSALERAGSLNGMDWTHGLTDHAVGGHHSLEVVVIGAEERLLFSSMTNPFAVADVMDAERNVPRQAIVMKRVDQSYRALVQAIDMGGTRDSVVVAVAMDMLHHEAFMRSFKQTLWVFMAVAVGLTGLLGWSVARQGLAPLRTMRDQTRGVTAQHLNQRLVVASLPVELRELAQSLNDMLERLEDAFVRLSGFSSDIAHELRTPVSNLMTETQVALSQARSADAYRNILESNAEEFERMARMISDMLLLAKAENDLVVPDRQRFSLSTEILALFDYYDAVADEKDVHLELDGNGDVYADQLMLRRAFGNLLSNAIRHARDGTTIRVDIVDLAGSIQIRISNVGEPIPAEYLERIFDRFFRVDPSRHRSNEGTGLGLAITRSIVIAHGGTIGAQSSADLTVFTILLPKITRM